MHQYYTEEYLQHYGVKGMKWGVRRARKMLSKATSSEQRDKAISSLEKHKAKGTAKVQKLQKKGIKLEEQSERQIIKNETKAARLNAKAARTKNKAYGRFVSADKGQKLLYEADKLEAQANKLLTQSKNAKAKVEANKAIIKSFERELSKIDTAFVEAGKRYVNG